MEGQVTAGGGTLEVVLAGGGNFQFNAVDFAAYSESGTGTQTLDVQGYLGATLVGTEQYTLTNTLTLTPTYANWTTESASVLAGQYVSELLIVLNANESADSYEAIDNVNLATGVPEPASVGLMGSGLAWLGYLWRKRPKA